MKPEADDVGLHRREIDGDAGQADDPLGKPARLNMILDEPEPVVLERVQRAGGDNAALPDTAAKQRLEPPSALDERT